MKPANSQQTDPELTPAQLNPPNLKTRKRLTQRIILIFGMIVLLFPVIAMVISVKFCQGVSKHSPESRIDFDKIFLSTILTQYQIIHQKLPEGDTQAVFQAMRGNDSKTNLLSPYRKEQFDPNGVLLDPWETGYRIYFSGNEILIRSAGPNRTFNDPGYPNSDDIFR